MPENLQADITTLLEDIRTGKQGARDQFANRVLNELRELAGRFMRQERANHLLQPTALVNEAFVRLLPGENLEGFKNRAHFFAAAATAMRHILVDHARQRNARKRGGDREQEPWDSNIVVGKGHKIHVEKLHEALINLALVNERQARVVELRFFGGMTIQDIAEHLNVSLATVERDWRFARAWLREHLEGMA